MRTQNEITIPKNTCEGCRNRDELNRCLAEKIDKDRKQIEDLKKQLSQKVRSAKTAPGSISAGFNTSSNKNRLVRRR
jgi:hypothetical protein